MSTPDHSIDSKLLKSAEKEFLDKGFLEASLKRICEQAEVTTGALYKRYKGKEELFCAVVQDTAEELEAYANRKLEIKLSNMTDEELINSWSMEHGGMI